MSRASWRAQAACRGLDPNYWFPEKGQSTATAKAICHDCPVRKPCLAFALADPTLAGIWGGTSARQRRRPAHRPA